MWSDTTCSRAFSRGFQTAAGPQPKTLLIVFQVKQLLASCHNSGDDVILSQCTSELLEGIIDRVTRSVPWERYHLYDQQVCVSSMAHHGQAIKVQN